MSKEISLPSHEIRLPPWAQVLSEEVRRYHGETHGHQDRVGKLTYALWGERLNRCDNGGPAVRIPQETMYYAGALHDVGKLGIPLSILDKPGHLNDQEASVMVGHTESGYEIVKQHDPLIAEIIRGHHDWGKNGLVYIPVTGAPLHEEIQEAQQVLAIADKTDATLHSRPEHPPRTLEQAHTNLYHFFEKELKSGIIVPTQLDLSIQFAQELGLGV